MPTEHKKTKSKTNVEIKVEGQELHPLSHYIDDRVELIRQIFMSLKSKTIKSIAPDFLQVSWIVCHSYPIISLWLALKIEISFCLGEKFGSDSRILSR